MVLKRRRARWQTLGTVRDSHVTCHDDNVTLVSGLKLKARSVKSSETCLNECKQSIVCPITSILLAGEFSIQSNALSCPWRTLSATLIFPGLLLLSTLNPDISPDTERTAGLTSDFAGIFLDREVPAALDLVMQAEGDQAKEKRMSAHCSAYCNRKWVLTVLSHSDVTYTKTHHTSGPLHR